MCYSLNPKLQSLAKQLKDARCNWLTVMKKLQILALLWWRLNQTRFPRLACLAEKYLAIQATSAPSERLFSAAGLTIAKDRASLLPDNAAMLIFLHDNLPIARAWKAQRGLLPIA